MTTPELIQFVKDELASGIARNVIAAKLEKEGWNAGDIIDVFNIVEQKQNDHTPTPPPQASSMQTSKEPKILFIQQTKNKTYNILLFIIIFIFIICGGALFYGSGLIFSSKLLSQSLSAIRSTKGVVVDVHMNTDTSSPNKNIDLTMKGSFNLMDKNNLKSDTSFKLKFDGKEISSNGFSSKMVADLTSVQEKNLYDITDRSSLIKITKRHLPSMVDGHLSYHFDFDLDREGVTSYLKETLNYLKNNNNNNELSLLEDSDYSKIIELLNNFHGEMWIGIFDNLPRKIIVNGDFINKEGVDNKATKISMTILATNWGETVVVKAPSGSIPSVDLLDSLFGNSEVSPVDTSTNISMIKEDSVDLSKKNIINSISEQSKIYYTGNNQMYKGFCRNKINGAYTLAITLPQDSIYKCNDKDDSWISYVKLSSDNYWCVDSNGFKGENTELPTSLLCSLK